MVQEEFVVFELLGTNPRYFFSSYTDRAGDVQFIQDGKDEKGLPKKKKFQFGESGFLKVHSKKKAEIKFLEEGSMCEGSPNLSGNPMYRRIDVELEATNRIDAKADRVRAQGKVLDMKKDELVVIGPMCGVNSELESILRDGIMNFAENNPAKFLEMISEENLAEVEVRSFLIRAQRRGIIKKTGTTYEWEGIRLGGSEREAVDKLMADEDLYGNINELFRKTASGESGAIPLKRKMKSTSVMAKKQKTK